MGYSNVLGHGFNLHIFHTMYTSTPIFPPFRNTENLHWHQPVGSHFLGQKLGTLCREVTWRTISSSPFEGLVWFYVTIGE